MTRQRTCFGVPEVQTEDCDLEPCPCDIVYQDLEGSVEPTVVWVEKDGVPGPTADDEVVRNGDSVSDLVTLYYNCKTCVCDNGKLVCVGEECAECTFSPWSEWSECTESCATGLRHRNQTLIQKAYSIPCEDIIQEQDYCNTFPCPVWSAWSEWGLCDMCEGGVRYRTRDCVNQTLEFNMTCDGPMEENDHCEVFPHCIVTPPNCTNNQVYTLCANTCPRTCADFRGSSACVDTEGNCEPGCGCAEGYLLDGDTCVQTNECPCYDIDGRPYPIGWVSNRTDCETCKCGAGGDLECERNPDCDADCQYSEWSGWGDCVCPNKTTSRFRTPNPDKKGDGKPCDGPSQESKECEVDDQRACDVCYVDGAVVQAGDEWPDPDNDCAYCWCAAGRVSCNHICGDPVVCDEGDEKIWSGPNGCCLSCNKPKSECQIHSASQTISDESSGCLSIEPVEFKYCDGVCGNSTDFPVISPSRGDHFTVGSCKCCTAKSTQQKAVLMSCPTEVEGELETREFFLPIVNQCLCLDCQVTT